MRDEDSLIQRIARAVPSQMGRVKNRYGVMLGIGDDAAILSRLRGEWVVSCDAFIEGVHFLADVHPGVSVGYKALVRAASDLVAMGAKPRLFLLTLALPTARTGHWLDGFLAGMRRAARYLDMRLAGGDTTESQTVGISITVLGQTQAAKSGRVHRGPLVLTRSGAHQGDRIYVTGTLGRAQLGLELVRKGRLKDHGLAPLLQPHLYPRLCVGLGCWLARKRVASTMMDLSDGLSSDLTRLCRASSVGAKLWANRIPAVSVPAPVSRLLSPRVPDALQMALHGGDDYELLFTVPPRNEARLRSAPDSSALTCVGEITRERRIMLVGVNGQSKPLRPRGWDPFRKQTD